MESNNEKKVLVVYYSYDDSTKTIAEMIVDETGADLFELVPLEESGGKRVKYMWEGESVIMNPTPRLKATPDNLGDYDLIFFGTPVWAMSYAPPFESLFNSTRLHGKNVALFCTHEGLMGIVFQEMINRLKDNKIVGTVDFYDPVGSGIEYAANAGRNWARHVLKSILES